MLICLVFGTFFAMSAVKWAIGLRRVPNPDIYDGLAIGTAIALAIVNFWYAFFVLS